MMQLLITVMAIGLAALLAVGGINYFSTDIGVRVEVSQGLRSQHDAIAGAVSSYKTANNGFVPGDIKRLAGYLPNGKAPEFPIAGQPFKWKLHKSGSTDLLCLFRDGGSPGRGAVEGIVSFARSRVSQHPGSLTYGLGCEDAANPDSVDGTDGVYDGSSGLDVEFFQTHPDAAIAIREF